MTLSEQNYCGKIGFRCGAKAQQVEHEHDDEHEHEHEDEHEHEQEQEHGFSISEFRLKTAEARQVFRHLSPQEAETIQQDLGADRRASAD